MPLSGKSTTRRRCGDHRFLHADRRRSFQFGQIAATNAISDIYAMGGTPIFALAVVGMPTSKLDTTTIRRAFSRRRVDLRQGADSDRRRPYDRTRWNRSTGLVAIGLVRPDQIKRNFGAKPGDRLILGKALGVGIYSAAFRKEAPKDHDYDALIARRPSSTRRALRCLQGCMRSPT